MGQMIDRLHKLVPFLFLSGILLLVSSLRSSAQSSLEVFNIVDTAYPVMEADFYAVYGGKLLRNLTKGDFVLRENGDVMRIISVDCPPETPVPGLSIVFVVDISGSMNSPLSSGDPMTRLDAVKKSVHAILDGLDTTEVQAALVSFNARSYLNRSLSYEMAEIHSALDELKPEGGTDYDAGLLASRTGALSVLKGASHRKIVIFLTDGTGHGDETKIIEQSMRDDVTIYTIAVGLHMPQSLKNISDRTGGLWFEVFDPKVLLETIYRMILYHAAGSGPCHIVWESANFCAPVRNVDLKYPQKGLTTFFTYLAPEERFYPTLNPTALRFGPVVPGQTLDLPATLTSHSDGMIVSNITCPDPRFEILELTNNPDFLPVTLDSGDALTITVRYAPIDSVPAISRIMFETNVCSTPELPVSGGFGLGDGVAPHVILTHPNGGEEFYVGTDTVLTWRGIAPDVPVRLEYSIDSGKTWTTITERTDNLLHNWHVPNTPSRRCLARVTVLPIAKPGQFFYHMQPLVDGIFMPGGQRIATLSNDGWISLWSAVDGSFLQSIGGVGAGTAIVTNSTGTEIALVGAPDGTIKVWNLQSGNLMNIRDAGQMALYAPDGRLITAYTTTPTGSTTPKVVGLKAVNVAANQENVVLLDPRGFYQTMAFNPDGSIFVTAGANGIIQFWNSDFSRLIQEVIDPNGWVRQVAFSFDGSLLFTLSTGLNSDLVSVWDVARREHLRTISIPRGTIEIDPALLTEHIVAGGGSLTMNEWFGGTSEMVFEGHIGGVTGVDISPDGKRILSVGSDKRAIIWDVPEVVSDFDRSDSLWAIVKPSAATFDIEFGVHGVGTRFDTLVTAHLVNTGTTVARVDSMVIRGGHRADFGIVSGGPPFTLKPGEVRDVELSFSPGFAGSRSAELLYFLPFDTVIAGLHGTATEIPFRLGAFPGDYIDFGKVPLGKRRDSIAFGINTSSVPVRIDSIRIAGPEYVAFEWSPRKPFPLTIRPGDSLIVDIAYVPQKTGLVQTYLEVFFNQPGSPAYIEMLGEGIMKGEPLIDVSDPLLLPDELCVGSVEEGEVTIYSRGDTALIVSQIGLDGTHQSEFNLDTLGMDFPIAIEPGDSLKVRVRFSPSDTGERHARVLVSSNGANSSMMTIPVSGRLDRVELQSVDTIADGVVDLGTFCPDQPISLALHTINVGSIPAGGTVTLRSSGVVLVESVPASSFVLNPGDTIITELGLKTGEQAGPFEVSIELFDTLCGTGRRMTWTGTVSSPSVTIDRVEPVCAGTELRLHAEGGEAYLWNGPGIVGCTDCADPLIRLDSTSTYIVTTITSAGCVASDTITIEAITEPTRLPILVSRGYRAQPGDTIRLDVWNVDAFPAEQPVSDLTFHFAYDGRILAIDTVSLRRGLVGTLLQGWTISRMEYRFGSLEVELKGPAPMQIRNAGSLLGFDGIVYLSSAVGTEFDVTVTTTTGCLAFEQGRGYVAVDSICGLNYRLFEMGLGRYQMRTPYPNPGGPNGISIDFSLGLDGPTRVTATAIDGTIRQIMPTTVLDPGEYSLHWETENEMPGVYIITVESGAWSGRERVVVVR